MNSRQQLLPFVCMLFLGDLAFGQRDLTDIPQPDPAEELKTFQVADGFEVNLFAADPQIHKPIQINFDPQGRLWVAASEVYPQIAPGQTANDKILILEDTDRDGVADKTTVFADGLLIPTAVMPGDGGAYVANSTELLHLSDTDGDGRADRRRIILSGFGTEDTHHILHTFRWGPEGLFYMNQSIYIHSHIETPFGVKRLNAGGIWRFRPETLELNVLARGWINAWGHAFDRWGQSFVTDGAGGEGINYVVPGASYPTAFGAAEVLHGLNPGSPKYCGLAIVDGPHFPDDWQGNLITHDFRGHRVCRFSIDESGSAFTSTQLPDLISSRHVAFRPIDVQQGPDGALYIADWYNPIIQHGEVDFRDARRDHVHGRIWRVTAKNRPLTPRIDLANLPTPQLLDCLKAPESFTRQQAKRVLKERGREAVLPELHSWLAQFDTKDIQVQHHRLEALWLYESFDEVQPQLLKELLASPEPRARAAAVRVVSHWANRLDSPELLLTDCVNDEFPRVRLETVRALAAIPTVRAAELALAVTDLPLDGYLDYATRQTIRELKPVWLPAVVAGKFEIDGQLRRLMFAIQAAQATEIIPQLVHQLEQNKVADNERPRVLELIGSLGEPQQLALVLSRAMTKTTPANEAADLLRALKTAQIRRNVRPSGDLSLVATLLNSPSSELAILAAECLGAWKLSAAIPELQALALSSERDDALRRAAIAALANVGAEQSGQTLKELASGDTSETISAAAISALVTINPNDAAELSVHWLKRSKSPEQQQYVIQAFLRKQGAAGQLAAALADATLPADAAKIALRTVTGSGRPEVELTEALTRAGGIKNQAIELSSEEMLEMVKNVRDHGDASLGELVFRRQDLSCQKCHAIGGAGGKVGPDLISIGASAQVDYLVDSLLAPNKKVKEGYQTAVVVTDEGKVLTGIKVRQSNDALILRNVDDQEIAIPLSQIDEEVSGSSLMPAGLTDKLTKEELLHLTRFLSELGKPGKYAIDPTVAVARTWQVLQPDSAAYTRLRRTSDAQVMADDAGLQWRPEYTLVNGQFPVADLPSFETKANQYFGARRVAYVRTWIELTEPGNITLQWNDEAHLQLWVNRVPTEISREMTMELPGGRIPIAVAIDLLKRETPLQLRLKGKTTVAKFVQP